MHFGRLCLDRQRDAAKSPRETFLETLDVTERFIQNGAVEDAGHHFRVPKAHVSSRLRQARLPIYFACLAGDPETQARSARSRQVPFLTP
ncbi:MAG TPA: hypothetical protein VKU84_10805 [Stellaceae bacterium]|nr:hypothetical protein [Stellaceae bacterium]